MSQNNTVAKHNYMWIEKVYLVVKQQTGPSPSILKVCLLHILPQDSTDSTERMTKDIPPTCLSDQVLHILGLDL